MDNSVIYRVPARDKPGLQIALRQYDCHFGRSFEDAQGRRWFLCSCNCETACAIVRLATSECYLVD